MKDKRIENLAKLIVNYSLNLKKGESVIIEGEPIASPLMKEIYREALKSKAFAYYHLVDDEFNKIFFDIAEEEQLKFIHDIEWGFRTKFTARARILAETNTRIFTNNDPKKEKIYKIARRELIEKAFEKTRWNVCLFPTNAYAQDAEMSLEELEDFVYKACFCDKENPVEKFEIFIEYEKKLEECLSKCKEVRIKAKDTDLRMRVEGRKFILEEGKINLPAGEIFTGPVEDSVNGEIKFTYPLIYGGKEISGIWFKFKDGRVVDFDAEKNKETLKELINTDEGSNKIGELGIGTNPYITKFCKNILLDEKIIGTIHLALGKSYPETNAKNKSTIHVDIVCDLRDGGEILLDNTTFQKNGEKDRKF